MDIPQEVPVDFMVNGKKSATFMCTPTHLKELAVGYLCGTAVVKGMGDIATVGACEDMQLMTATLNVEHKTLGLGTVIASGCGSAGYTPQFDEIPPIESDFTVSMDDLSKLAREMFDSAECYKQHGGIHISALSDGKKLFAAIEDVGRHNTVDKVIGFALLNGIPLENSAIITSGRIAVDMVLKALNARVPVLVSRSVPTTYALDMAEKKGVTIVGRIGKERIVFSHKYRIIL